MLSAGIERHTKTGNKSVILLSLSQLNIKTYSMYVCHGYYANLKNRNAGTLL